jgi:hypothetical protein
MTALESTALRPPVSHFEPHRVCKLLHPRPLTLAQIALVSGAADASIARNQSCIRMSRPIPKNCQAPDLFTEVMTSDLQALTRLLTPTNLADLLPQTDILNLE